MNPVENQSLKQLRGTHRKSALTIIPNALRVATTLANAKAWVR
jgi:hypothetical protein